MLFILQSLHHPSDGPPPFTQGRLYNATLRLAFINYESLDFSLLCRYKDSRGRLSLQQSLAFTQGPCREGAVTEGDWGRMRERVICSCDIGGRRTFTENSFRLFASQKSTSLSEGGFVVRPYVELSSITEALIFRYCADGGSENRSPTTALPVTASISVIFRYVHVLI